MDLEIANALRQASDADILEEVDVRRLEEDVILHMGRGGLRLYDADVNDLIKELEGRGEHVIAFSEDTQEIEKIYHKHLCGKSEEAGKEALEFFRKVLGKAL
jgi:hypothetical protein